MSSPAERCVAGAARGEGDSRAADPRPARMARAGREKLRRHDGGVADVLSAPSRLGRGQCARPRCACDARRPADGRADENGPGAHGCAARMKVSILDDYFDTLRTLACFKKLHGHEVEIWNDHVEDTDVLAQRLKDTEALV